MAEPRYETAYELGQRIGHTDSVVCADCGVFVMDKTAHTRFHSILSAHAWALAILKTRHIGPAVHDRYDVVERINSKRFDSWSGDALAEVIAAHGQQEAEGAGKTAPGMQCEFYPLCRCREECGRG